MNPRKSTRPFLPSGGPPAHSASADAARRAKRARDHLERKRSQERRRRQRERDETDRLHDPAPAQRLLSLITFLAAMGAGTFAAIPLSDLDPLGAIEIDRVDIQGASVLTPAAIVQAARLDANSVPKWGGANAVVRSLEAEPWIESARVLRLPTGSLVVSIVERDAVAIWKPDAKDDPKLVDRRGERFDGDLEPAGALPIVAGPTRPELDSLPTEALEILTALEAFSSFTMDPRALTLHLPRIDTPPDAEEDDGRSGYILELGSEGPRALLGKRLFTERVARLAALVESGEATFVASTVIDLRYADRAVLRTEPVSG